MAGAAKREVLVCDVAADRRDDERRSSPGSTVTPKTSTIKGRFVARDAA